MIIKLSPIASYKDTKIFVDGTTLTIDNVSYDLSAIPENGEADAEESGPFLGIVKRDNITVLYRYNSNTADSSQGSEVFVFDISKGNIPDLIKRKGNNITWRRGIKISG